MIMYWFSPLLSKRYGFALLALGCTGLFAAADPDKIYSMSGSPPGKIAIIMFYVIGIGIFGTVAFTMIIWPNVWIISQELG